MFLGNLISNIIGGVVVGLVSGNLLHVFVFSLLWVIISLVNLFIFQKSEFKQFEKLIEAQGVKGKLKTAYNSNLIWVIITGLFAFVSSYLLGLLILFLK